MRLIFAFICGLLLPISAHALSISSGLVSYSVGVESGAVIEIGQELSFKNTSIYEITWGRYLSIDDTLNSGIKDDNYFIEDGFAASASTRDLHVFSIQKKSYFNIGNFAFSVSYGPAIAHSTKHIRSGFVYIPEIDAEFAVPTYVKKNFDYGIHSNFEAILWKGKSGTLSWQLPWVREMLVDEEFLFTTGFKFSR